MMNYKVLLLDLDGTIYVDGKPINNIVDQLNEFIADVNNELYFVSNNTSTSRYKYVEKLRKLGFEITIENIVTPTVVAGSYLAKKHNNNGYIVGTRDFQYELKEDFDIVSVEEKPAYVLISFDRELTYEKVKKACEFINQGVPYYITNIDLACPSDLGPIPDCGAIADLVFKTTGVDYKMSFGKPTDNMVDYLTEIIGDFEKKEILMVGDRLYTDIALGNNVGSDTLLVLTGEATLEDYKENKKYDITHCAETLTDFISCHILAK